MTLAWLIPLVVLLSCCMTALLRRYALARSIVDIPNSRSSHSLPTPRGGGVAIVLSFLISMVVVAAGHLAPLDSLVALGGSTSLVALIGFMDDHGHIAARWRLLGHFLSACWALCWLGGLPEFSALGVKIDSGWLGLGVATFYLVWMLNLYNFMDGIDGIASVEAISVCIGISIVYVLAGHAELIVLPVLLSAAVLGFLWWNFPPARIFMGDAGSGFLGIALAVLSLQAAWEAFELFWCWLILLGVFIVDATFTLLRRLTRGEKLYEAHRSHAYQYAARLHGKHRPVTLAVAALMWFWLLPIALCVVLLDLDGLVGLLVAYVPLVFLAVKYHSGAIEKRE